MRRFGFQFSQLILQEGSAPDSIGIEQNQLIRVGRFTHSEFGEFEITKEILLKLKENFDNNARRTADGHIPIDYFHEEKGIAAGWIQEVFLTDDDTSLSINVEWTPAGKQKITDKELKYLSADLHFQYKDNESGQLFGPTLFGAGLTNRPHIKEMSAIFGENLATDFEAEELNMNFEQLMAMLASLTPDQMKQVMEKMKEASPDTFAEADPAAPKVEDKPEDKPTIQSTETGGDMDNKETEIKLSEKDTEIEELKQKLETSEKEKEFNVLLSEGKAVEAQKEFYLKGDIAGFTKAHVAVKLDDADGNGGGTGEDGDKLTAEQAEDKLIKLSETKSKEEKIDFGEAMSLVLSEEKELAKTAGRA